MPKPKPTIVRLSELLPGQSGDFFALLKEKARNARRDGKPFFTCRLRDALRTATFMVWSDGPWFEVCEKEWQEGQFYKIRAAFEEHPIYGPQIDLLNIRAVEDKDQADGFEPGDFVEASRFNTEAMYQELCTLAETHIADEPLRRLALTILERHSKRLKRAPGTLKHYYPFVGGLLEHTLSVTHSCIQLCDKYGPIYAGLKPPLNRDLVLAGAILHDLGRCLELTDDLVNPQPTVPGSLLGHLILGRDMVRTVALELGDVDPELLQLLEHLLLAHLTLPEWGSPRLPMIPECLILHHADDLDAKLEMYARCLARDQAPGPFTARDPVLGKKLLKGRRI